MFFGLENESVFYFEKSKDECEALVGRHGKQQSGVTTMATRGRWWRLEVIKRPSTGCCLET